MKHRISSAVLLILAASQSSPAFSQDSPGSPKAAASEKQIRMLIAQLDADDYFVRQQATKRLPQFGAGAVPLLVETAANGSAEAGTRAMTVMAILVESPDAKVAAAAEKGLRKLAASKNKTAAGRAEFLLKRPNRLRRMRRLLRDVRMSLAGRMKGNELQTDVEKLYRFSDVSRTHMDGALSVWTRDGRPEAFVKLWTVADGENRWGQGFISAASVSLHAELDRKPVWTPTPASPQRAPIEKAPEPAKTKAARLRQMTALAKRFTAREFWTPGRTEYELTLRAGPILRFQSEKNGVLDGAVFVYCHDTNPEAILLLEAIRRKGATPLFQYSVFRGGDSELHVELDRREVLVEPRVHGGIANMTDTYRVLLRTIEDDPAAKRAK